MTKITGLTAAPFTPMNERGDLALDRIGPTIELLNRNGVNGAFICGTTGEGPSLTHNEKIRMMEAWGDSTTESLKTIFMLGGTSIREIKDLASRASKNRMNGTSVLCPFFFIPKTVDSLVDFCQEVASAAPELPFYYYHIPSMTRGHFSMRLFLEKAEGKIPNLAGIKYTGSDLFDFQECVSFEGGKYNLLWGQDEALLSGLAAGADGAVGSTYNYAAPLYHKVISAFNSGDLTTARFHQNQSVKMVRLLNEYGGIEAGKAFMKLIGMDCGWCRPPLGRLSDPGVEKLHKKLLSIGFYEYCSKA